MVKASLWNAASLTEVPSSPTQYTSILDANAYSMHEKEAAAPASDDCAVPSMFCFFRLALGAGQCSSATSDVFFSFVFLKD
jgi:hypothetical protein